ncbi:MAG: hypothetical protein J6S43_00275 [Lentisphaeria bacterium]|nr:hypothetical protein [Lentisphaeria bacterium]
MIKRKTVLTGALCEAGDGMYTPDLIVRENLGSFLALFSGPWQPDMLRRVCDFARKNQLRIQMDEVISRLAGTVKEDYLPYIGQYAEILHEYADVIECAGILHEYGGVRFYWPRSSIGYGFNTPENVSSFTEAEKELQDKLRRSIANLRKTGINLPLKSVEARGLAIHHYLRGGVDKADVEMTYQPDTEMLYSGAKGASLAFGKDSFGVDLATLWYGGNVHDELFFKRWHTSLCHAFIRGADPIYAEHGIAGFKQVLGNSAQADDPVTVRFREVLSRFRAFTAGHPRPAGLPEASAAVMQGYLDGYAGADQTHLWGIRDDDRFRTGTAEESWKLFHELYRRSEWHNRELTGDCDLSGNPPLGQADIIPWDTPDEVLQNYKLVILLGRNVMSHELYCKLLKFVRNGGQLLLTAAHMNTRDVPDGEYLPYNNGDWRELCGVTLDTETVFRPFGIKFRAMPDSGWVFPLWTTICDPKFSGNTFPMADLQTAGAGILAAASDKFNDQEHESKADGGTTDHASDDAGAESQAWKKLDHCVISGYRNGKGEVILLNSLDYPGASGVKELYLFLMKAACRANTGYPAVESSDRVRYAVYPGKERTLYLLNTEENLDAPVIIHWSEKDREKILLAPGEILELPVK